MASVPPPEVFTADELARAAGTPRDQIEALLAGGQISTIPGTRFVARRDALRAGLLARRAAAAAPLRRGELFERPLGPLASRQRGVPAMGSSALHGVLIAAAFLLTSMPATTSVIDEPVEPVRLVFLALPGPGGGGGGGGLRNPLPPPVLERTAPAPRRAASVPAVAPVPTLAARRESSAERPEPAAVPLEATPPEPAPEPRPSEALVAPVAESASDARDRAGVIEGGRGQADSQGPGAGGGSGAGQGIGNGGGLGAGIGDGMGGGIGGGPYRPGSGVEPPRLLREVKATYTDEARRRGLSGDVLLEIVVRRDGTVGDVRVLRALGAGLDGRAVQAVRQWRFDPARRRGVPVDVLVEVAVEFILR